MQVEPSSIRGRLLWQLGVLFACGMVVLYLAATSYARFAADSSYDRLLLGSAGSIAETLSINPGEVRVDIPYAALDMLSAAPDDRVFYRVIGTDGATVTGYADLPDDPASRPKSGAPRPTRFFDARYRGEMVRFVLLGREVRFSGQSGWVWVQVGQTREARRSLAWNLTIRALLPIVALTILAALVVWASVGRAVRPLESIGQDLAARKASDLSPITAPVPQEIAPLVQSVNQFMARLGNNMEFLRNFIATAAHQLRTPLTALLVQIRSAELSKGAARAAKLEAARQSANRLARLVDQLLSDAMVTHRAEQRRLAPFDLKRVVERSLHDTLPISHDADVRFTTGLAAANLIGDEVMVAEAIKNLLHNALHHGAAAGGADSRIELLLVERDGGYELAVSDNGPGMSKAALARIGDRFQSGSTEQGGAGIGLSIVRQVLEGQGGTTRFESRPEGGLRAILWFPIAP